MDDRSLCQNQITFEMLFWSKMLFPETFDPPMAIAPWFVSEKLEAPTFKKDKILSSFLPPICISTFCLFLF